MARYALVIGISEYKNPLLRLPKTTTDAEAVVQVLKKYGDFQQVIRLPQRWNPDKNDYEMAAKPVTGSELAQALRNFLLEQAVGDDALIYFTGHGIKVSDNLGQEKGYLVTSDCAIATEGNKIIGQQNGISLDGLNELIRGSNLRSLVLLLDCCHSGYFLERQLVEQSLTTITSQRDYYLITACRSFEQAIAFDFEKHDVFTGALIEGLSVENAGENGQISGDRLFDHISSTLKGSKQEPIRMGWGRSITLVTYPQEEITTEEIAFNTENPYRGLYSFESEQEKYFCGREQAVRALLDRLSSNRFLSVIGPSGCGKSSLVKAGLLPHLERDRLPGSSQWGIETFTPGKHPLTKLIEILERQHRQNQPFVLFIDQMEEVFTLCEDDSERQSFIRLMADEATNSERLTRVIVAIRTDFLDRCAAYPEVANLINRTQPTTYIVAPLSRPELEEAIKEPAFLHGVKFERRLISQIADDVDEQPGALPLLQYALKELWRVCIEESDFPEPRLTWKGYEEIGRVKGALENRANLLYQSFSPTDRDFVRRMCMELVQLGEENTVTRRRASWERLEAKSDSIDQLRRVVGLLADQRLIVTDENTVEVAHEALLTEWTLLRGWIEENRENIRLSRLLEAECREWQKRFNKSDEALLTGAKLATIAEWKEKTQPQPKLPVEEAEFLRRSLEKRDKEIQEELEQERQLRELAETSQKEAEARAIAEIEKAREAEGRAKAEAEKVEEIRARARAELRRTQVAVGAGFLVTILLAAFGFSQVQAANKEARAAKISEVNGLTILAETYLENDKQLEALIWSVKALKALKNINDGDINNFNRIKLVVSKIQENNRFSGHNNEVLDVSLSPNGEVIASASWDKTVKLWSKNGKFLADLKHTTGSGVWGVTFSPDGQVIAAADTDGITKLWNINSKSKRELKTEALENDDSVIKVTFSRNGQMIASSNWDKTIKIWRVADGKLIQTLKDKVNSAHVYGISFSQDGQTIASANKDKTIRLWKLADGKVIKTFRGHSGLVFGVSFSSDGRTLASASWDKTVKLWRVADGKLLQNFQGHSDDVNGVNFSPDSKMIASASKDKTIKIWRVVDGKLLQTFKGHSDAVNSVIFSYDNKNIVSASDDNTVRIWTLNPIDTKVNNPYDLLNYSCTWLNNYLKYNIEINQQNRSVCDNI